MTKDLFDIAVKNWDSQKRAALAEQMIFFRVFPNFPCFPRPWAFSIHLLHSRNSMTKDFFDLAVKNRDSQKRAALTEQTAFFRTFRVPELSPFICYIREIR
jgi:hypothetical protein